MARIDEIERRLLNWARWKAGCGSGGLGFASVNLASEGIRASLDGPVIPTIECDAELTDRAVQALPSELRETVVEVYCRNGLQRVKAQRLGCSEATIHARIGKAHPMLRQWFSDQAELAREHRLRERAALARSP